MDFMQITFEQLATDGNISLVDGWQTGSIRFMDSIPVSNSLASYCNAEYLL